MEKEVFCTGNGCKNDAPLQEYNNNSLFGHIKKGYEQFWGTCLQAVSQSAYFSPLFLTVIFFEIYNKFI